MKILRNYLMVLLFIACSDFAKAQNIGFDFSFITPLEIFSTSNSFTGLVIDSRLTPSSVFTVTARWSTDNQFDDNEIVYSEDFSRVSIPQEFSFNLPVPIANDLRSVKKYCQ